MWTNFIYGFIVLTNIAMTGETWYASPPTRWQVRIVDEAEILLGGAERCIATQTNEASYQVVPMEYVEEIRGTNGAMITVTNALTWQLAGKGMLESNDAAFKAAIPFYVRTNSVYDGSTNFIPMTFTGVVAELGIGFSNWPWQVVYTNYEDRYKVLNLMEKTWRDAEARDVAVWRGHGTGSNWSEAYGAAVSNYAQATGAWTALDQHVKGGYWQNFYTNYIPGEYTNTLLGSNYVVVGQYMTVTTVSNVIVTTNQATGGNITTDGNYRVHTFLSNGTFDATAFSSNITIDALVVAGGGGGGGQAVAGAGGGGGAGGLVYLNSGSLATGTYAVTIGSGGAGGDLDVSGANGQDSVFDNVTAMGGGGGGAEGSAGEDGGSGGGSGGGSEYVGGAALQTNSGGGMGYGNKGGDSTGMGGGGGGGGAGSAGQDGTVVDGSGGEGKQYDISGSNEWYAWGGSGGSENDGTPNTGNGGGGAAEVGQGSSGGSGIVIIRYEPEIITNDNPVDPTGTYNHDGDYPPTNQSFWTGPGWYAIYNGGNYYITQDTNALSPAWRVTSEEAGADDPGLEYSTIVGTGIYGTATAVYGYEEDWVDNKDTHTNETGETEFYQCWLTKAGWSNTVYASSNITHQASHYVWPIAPSIGNVNIYRSTWDSNVWNLVETGSEGTDTNEAVWIGGTLATPPADLTTAPTNANQTVAEGWSVTNKRVILDWDFLYATNRYW